MVPAVLLIGASVRAAAFSALRAGLRPRALDLFADRDLAAVCAARQIPSGTFPGGLPALARQAPPGPWLYTGALENHPTVIEQLTRDRLLWGNRAACLRSVRDPFALNGALRKAGVPCPAVSSLAETSVTTVCGRWLVRPFASAGGVDIEFVGSRKSRRTSFLQEFIDGESRSGVFVADRVGTRLLGVTRQLVGINWLHVAGFRYAGNIGPLTVSAAERTAWERLGMAVAAFAGLRGLFGIDAILRDGVPWPVEVNPRYTASVEVIEYATGVRALDLHRRAFAAASAEPSGRCDFEFPDTSASRSDVRPGFVGKAVWYAPSPITVPHAGPWDAVLRDAPALDEPPAFADIPPAGQRIAAGRPVMTVFAAADTMDQCQRRLQTIARELDERLVR
jgi:predicted ATP-grasp superfamily ATP-dependent carboligase